MDQMTLRLKNCSLWLIPQLQLCDTTVFCVRRTRLFLVIKILILIQAAFMELSVRRTLLYCGGGREGVQDWCIVCIACNKAIFASVPVRMITELVSPSDPTRASMFVCGSRTMTLLYHRTRQGPQTINCAPQCLAHRPM